MELNEVIEGLEDLRESCKDYIGDETDLILSEAIRYLKPVYNGEFTTDSDEVVVGEGFMIV